MVMEDRRQRVAAVVGAGMAGLTAAHELAKEGVGVTVFEKNSYVGGRIKTDVYEGQRIEGGAQSYFEFYDLTRTLIRELDLATYEAYLPGRPGIVHSRKFSDISSGAALLWHSGLSLRSKLLLGKLLRPLLAHWRRLDYERLAQAQGLDTRSVAQFAAEELNREILEYLFEPVLSGLFYWPSKEVSQAALFVLLRQALFRLRPMTLTCGLGSLPRAMAQDLDVRLNHTVTRIARTESGRFVVAARHGGGAMRREFDAVICATTARAVPRLIPALSYGQKKFFRRIAYSQNVNVAVEVEDNPMREMASVYVPLADSHIENLGAVTRQSRRVISLFSSARSGADLLGERDGVVSTRLLRDLGKALPAAADGQVQPISELVYRWPRALPVLDVGYFERLNAFQRGRDRRGKLVFCGDYLGGPFIEGAVSSGMEAANCLTSRL